MDEADPGSSTPDLPVTDGSPRPSERPGDANDRVAAPPTAGGDPLATVPRARTHDDTASPADSDATPSGAADPGARFQQRERVAVGGTGDLYFAFDVELQAPAALKAMAPGTPRAQESLDRPAVEALVNDPTVVPLRSRWQDTDGTIWLAMPWVHGGGTFMHVIETLLGSGRWVDVTEPRPKRLEPRARVQRVDPDVSWVDLPSALLLLVEAAAGVGTAHRAGVVHLDIKPDNLMFEMHGVPRGSATRREWRFWHSDASGQAPEPPRRMARPRVIDWGLSLRVGEAEAPNGETPGVPAYMAPERASGGPGATAPTADVYALGAVLYHLLTGAPPYGVDRRHTRALLTASPLPPAPEVHVHRRLLGSDTDDYVAVCRRAMDPDPRRRPPDASAFAVDLRRARSRHLLRRAEERLRGAEVLRARAREVRQHADAALARLDKEDYANIEPRQRWWSDLKSADVDEAEAHLREAQWVRDLRAILAVDPDFEALAIELIDWGNRRLLALERDRETAEARLALETLRADVQHVRERLETDRPASLPAPLIRAEELLAGNGRLTLPVAPDIEVGIVRLVQRHIRWTADEPFAPLGTGRIVAHPLEAGRYLLQLRGPGRQTAVLPLRIHRGETWDPTTDLGERRPRLIDLPPATEIGVGDVFIPAGPAWLGGDPSSHDCPMPGRSVWVDAFVVKAEPVTHRQWLSFINARRTIVDSAAMKAWLPGTTSDDAPGQPGYRLGEDGRYTLSHRSGDPAAMLDWPVCAISWHAARAFARWFDEHEKAAGRATGWRLISEWEYEKVARSGDARRVHWGEEVEPRFTRIAGSIEDLYVPASIHDDTLDVTLGGVRWIAGNAQTWCLEGWSFDGPWHALDVAAALRSAVDGRAPYRMIRGAAYYTPRGAVASTSRFAAPPDQRPLGAGLRLARSWPPLPVEEPLALVDTAAKPANLG